MMLSLGGLRFEALQVRGFRDGRTWSRVSHETIEDLPVLQTVGKEASTPELRIALHPELGDSAATYENLLFLGDQDLAVPLQDGTGQVLGWYMLSSVQREWQWATAEGVLAAGGLTIQLEECRPPGPDAGPQIGVIEFASAERTEPILVDASGDPNEVPLSQVVRL